MTTAVSKAPVLTPGRSCIMKPDTLQMYCGLPWGRKKEYAERRGSLTPDAIVKWEPDLEKLCEGCVDAYAAELMKDVTAKLRQLHHLGKSYRRV